MTQIQRVKRHIDEVGCISSQQAFSDYGITRLADVIFKLRRKHGLNIATEMIESKNRYGEKVSFGMYKNVV